MSDNLYRLGEKPLHEYLRHHARRQPHKAAYGLSETHTADTYTPREAIRWGTQGKLAPGVECRIVDPDSGRDLPPGAMGEIVLRSPGVFKGYWNKPEATAATLRDGWVHTGDMGTLDVDGYLSFVGRFKEMIKVSGYSIFPEEVELMLINLEKAAWPRKTRKTRKTRKDSRRCKAFGYHPMGECPSM